MSPPTLLNGEIQIDAAGRVQYRLQGEGCATDDEGSCKISHHEWETSSVLGGKNFVDQPRPSGGLSLVVVTFDPTYRDLGNVLGPVYVENFAQSRHPADYTGGEEVLE